MDGMWLKLFEKYNSYPLFRRAGFIKKISKSLGVSAVTRTRTSGSSETTTTALSEVFDVSNAVVIIVLCAAALHCIE